VETFVQSRLDAGWDGLIVHATRITPVEEQVTLREEHVHVERRPVDRATDNLPPDAFQDRTIEVRRKAEEAVVVKTARVTEEVVIRKDVEERADTVHRTEMRTTATGPKARGPTSAAAPRLAPARRCGS
jgi:stress response protein YsnF